MAHKKVCLGEQSYGYVDFIKKKKNHLDALKRCLIVSKGEKVDIKYEICQKKLKTK